MAIENAASGLSPVTAIALVGVIGVGAQWLAWRLRLPAIVLMLVAGVLVGPVTGIFDPDRDIGPLTQPMIAIAVAIILFEGGLTLNFHSLRDAATGVRRLVFIGAPLGWLTSTLALRLGAGLSWESAAVFGGIMIVTGPTVIAPLLRTARLSRRPAALLQWEAIVNDPIGALAAVLAFEVVLVLRTATDAGSAVFELVLGIGLAIGLGVLGGHGIARAFRRALVPEFMKVPLLFVVLLAVFAVSDGVLHESGLLAVTIMGVWIANADLPSYEEMRRFKEHATVLLVSGVFILLAASLEFGALRLLDWHAAAFVAAVVLVARPLTVLAALSFTKIPWNERLLVALTGPRGVVLVAVAGLFGSRLAGLGIEDGALIGPLAFVLVAATVVFHGFTLAPFARVLGLTAAETPGVLLVGGSRFTLGLGEALQKAGIPVLVTDPNRSHLRPVREAGLPTFYGDILSEAAEARIELMSFRVLIAATDNDAYNTLVATDLASEFGRENIYQLKREKAEQSRNQLPSTLGGQGFGDGATYNQMNRRMWQGWGFGTSELTGKYGLAEWRQKYPDAVPLAQVGPGQVFRMLQDGEDLQVPVGATLISMTPEKPQRKAREAVEG